MNHDLLVDALVEMAGEINRPQIDGLVCQYETDLANGIRCQIGEIKDRLMADITSVIKKPA